MKKHPILHTQLVKFPNQTLLSNMANGIKLV